MDKFFNSHWFVRLIAFFIALMLFTMVNFDEFRTQPGVLPTKSSANYTLEDVEVNVLYDEENYAIISQPESVKINLRGAQSDITMFQLTRPSFEVYVDVTEREEGVHTVTVEHRGFPKDLSVSIRPQFGQVELEEKQTVSLPVQVELEGEEETKEGYTVGMPIVTPVNVDVTAARSSVAQVAEAKVKIDVTGASKAIEEAAPVVLYDENGEELDLQVEPAVVDVRIPISSPYRSVPAKVNKVGELKKGYSIQDIQIEPGEVTIYGPSAIVEALSFVEVGDLDLSEIEESGTYQLQVKVPPGVEQVSPNTVDVTVEVGVEEEKELTDIPIDVIGESDGRSIAFAEGEEKSLTIKAKGTAPLLEKLTDSDVQAFVDVSDLSAGEHNVLIEFTGPVNIRLSSDKRVVAIIISNEASEGENE